MKATCKFISQDSNQAADKNMVNYAQALRKLKQVQARLEKRKKQIKAQGMKADRGKWQVAEAEKRAQLKKQIKDQSIRLQNQLISLKTKQAQKVAQLKKETERIRKQSLKKRSLSRLEILESKIRLNHDVRQKSLHATQRIIHLREQQLQKKRQQRLSMYGSRQQSRKSVQEFQASRVIQIRNSSSRQRDQLLQKLSKRQKELQHLERLRTSQKGLKAQKQHSTAQNLKSIDSSLRIYNPSSSNRKARKRSMSDNRFLKDSGVMLTQL